MIFAIFFHFFLFFLLLFFWGGCVDVWCLFCLCLVDFLNQIKGEISHEDDQVRNMFEHIADVYMNHISEYEYATERLSFKLTPSEMKKFQEVDGKNNKEKFKNLLNQI